MESVQKPQDPQWRDFWREAFAWEGSASPRVVPNVCLLGVLALIIMYGAEWAHNAYRIHIGMPVAPYEIFGATMGVVLVLRTNAGYDRWWEGRKLWGGIVNQSRNLAVSIVAYGSKDEDWRKRALKWVAAFPHATRLSLRREVPDERVINLLGPEDAERLAKAEHMPTFVGLQISALLREALDGGMNEMAFHQADRERMSLIDHMGACERILKTPLAFAYTVKIRRFLVMFLLLLPFALVQMLGDDEALFVPVVTMIVAYPLLTLDQLGKELQNPFAKDRLSHLPLDDICDAIQSNVMALG
jgi:putative membrane protein